MLFSVVYPCLGKGRAYNEGQTGEAGGSAIGTMCMKQDLKRHIEHLMLENI
jgi:hypothetical protein